MRDSRPRPPRGPELHAGRCRPLGDAGRHCHHHLRFRPPESQTEEFKFSQAYSAHGIMASGTSELDHTWYRWSWAAPMRHPICRPRPGQCPTRRMPSKTHCARPCATARSAWPARSARSRGTGRPRNHVSGSSAPAPSPEPTHAAGTLRCAASVSSSSPADYSTVDIYVRTPAGASVTTVAHYKTTDNQKTAVADGAGRAAVGYNISGATPGIRSPSTSPPRRAPRQRGASSHLPRCPDTSGATCCSQP